MTAEPQSKAAFVHNVFSQIARRYDLMNSVLSFQQHKLWRRFAMRQIHLPPGGKALDVAAGTGDWTLALARVAGPQGHVVGLDFCREMLEVAEEKLHRAKAGSVRDRLADVEFVEGDAMRLPFPDASFDVATIGFALRNVPDILTVLGEMRRVVKPGGQVVSLELSKPQSAVLRRLYYLYFYRILPWIGGLAVGDRAPYAWLPASLTDFPDRRGLEQLFRAAGLQDVRSYALTGGIAAVHVGRRLEEA
ncbi:MAG: demethylmenaquinone methyltransferase [Alicyclobacillus sp.]|nr:demethylmenaquinone methyltransferase [Alicyclobacillus sp.]